MRPPPVARIRVKKAIGDAIMIRQGWIVPAAQLAWALGLISMEAAYGPCPIMRSPDLPSAE